MPEGFLQGLRLNADQLYLLLPEALVAAGFLLALLYELISSQDRQRLTGYLCLLGLVAGLWASGRELSGYVEESNRFGSYLVTRPDRAHPGKQLVSNLPRVPSILAPQRIYSGMVTRDALSAYFRILILLGTAVAILVALHAKELAGNSPGEFYLLITATGLGGCFLASATNLLMIYLSLEALSIVSYALAGFLRQDRKSAEAGIKYVLYGAMASGIMIFGMSYLYGLTGTLDLVDVAAQFRKLAATGAPIGALAAVLAMVFCGLLYKIAAAPFHYWSPDVYEGAPTTATGFFSVVPKAAGFAVLVRVMAEFFPFGNQLAAWNSQGVERTIEILAVLTMTIGNLAALGQSNAKRMLAYSSIAHAGYMLAGLSVWDDERGAAAVLYYLAAYLMMNLGAFLVLVALENLRGGCELKDLRGAVRREPMLAVCLVIFLFSLTGFPPLAGFTGKYLILIKLADRGRWFLFLFIGLNSVISLYYYMRLAKSVTIDPPATDEETVERGSGVLRALAGAKVAALVVLFLYFDPVYRLCRQVVEPLRVPAVPTRTADPAPEPLAQVPSNASAGGEAKVAR